MGFLWDEIEIMCKKWPEQHLTPHSTEGRRGAGAAQRGASKAIQHETVHLTGLLYSRGRPVVPESSKKGIRWPKEAEMRKPLRS